MKAIDLSPEIEHEKKHLRVLFSSLSPDEKWNAPRNIACTLQQSCRFLTKLAANQANPCGQPHDVARHSP
jgi:hypothetical protein